MRSQSNRYLALFAVLMAVCMLFPSCISVAHTAEHACSHYDDCRLCQQFGEGELIAMLAISILSGCAFIHSPMRLRCKHMQRCFAPVTLISQSIQMND